MELVAMRNGRLSTDDLRHWRHQEGLTQREAARYFGVDRSRVNQWENRLRSDNKPFYEPIGFHERFIRVLQHYYGLKALADQPILKPVKPDTPGKIHPGS